MTLYRIDSHRNSAPSVMTTHRITAQSEASVRNALRIAHENGDVDICPICAVVREDREGVNYG